MDSRPAKRPFEQGLDDSDPTARRFKRPPSASPSFTDGLYDIPAATDLPKLPGSVGHVHVSQSTTPFVTTGSQAQFSRHHPHAAGVELEAKDVSDISVLLSDVPDTRRYAFAIEAIAERAVSREWPADDAHATVAPALGYFQLLRSELERRGSGLEAAITAQEAMLAAWQEKVGTWLGSTVRSFEQLGGVLESIVRQAEDHGGLPARLNLRESLHNAVFDIGNATLALTSEPPPALRDTFGMHTEVETAEFDVAKESSGGSVICTTDLNGDTLPAAEGDAAPSATVGQTALGMIKGNGEVPSVTEKFAEPYDLYRHHALKAKKSHLSERWLEADVKKAAKEEVRVEWASLSHTTLTAWADAHAHLLALDDAAMKSADVAHFFHKGHACSLAMDASRRDEGYSSAHPSSSATMPAEPTVEQEHPGPTPSPPSPPFTAKKITFDGGLAGAEKTVFLRVTLYKAKAREVDLACRGALGQNVSNTGTEECRLLRHQIFIVRFNDVKAARSLAGTQVTIRGYRHMVYSYPTQSPQVYIAWIRNSGPEAIRQDCIFPALASISARNAIHLRQEREPSQGRKKWVAIFKNCPRLLRFTVPILQQDGQNYKGVHFEPVSLTDACHVCHKGHSAWKCDLLTSMTAEQLGVDSDHPSYMRGAPKIR